MNDELDSSAVCNDLYLLARRRPGKTIRRSYNGHPVLLVQEPRDVQHILKNQVSNWPKNMAWLRQALGRSRVSENDGAWRLRRGLTQPHFNRYDVAGTQSVVCSLFKSHFSDWLLVTQETGCLPDALLRRLTLGIMTQVLLDTDLASTGIEPAHLLNLLELGSEFAFVPPGQLDQTKRKQRLRELNRAKAHVMRDLAVFRTPPFCNKPVIHEILVAEAQTRNTEDPVVMEQELITLFAAGSEANAASLGWACHLLAQHGDIQERLRDEARKALVENPLDLSRLPLLDDFVSEALRLFPPTPILSRYAREADTLSIGPVAAGTIVLISLIGLHTNPDWRDNPWTVDLAAARAHHNRLGSGLGTAFGLGERACGGRMFAMTELRSLLVYLLTHTRLEPVLAEPPHAMLDLEWRSQMVRRGGQRVRLFSMA